jgi:hypothetical protein
MAEGPRPGLVFANTLDRLHFDAALPAAAAGALALAARAAGAQFWGCFFVCCLYSVDVIKSAKGAYLEISSSSKRADVLV